MNGNAEHHFQKMLQNEDCAMRDFLQNQVSPITGEPVLASNEALDSEAEVDLGRFIDALADDALAQLPETPLTEKVKRKYRFVTGLRREALTRLLPDLPAPSEDIYILSNGSGAERKDGSDRGIFDFGAFVPYLVEKVAPSGGARVYISTWTINKRGALMLSDMMHDGRIVQLVFCVDQYFNKRDAATAKIIHDAMVMTGGHAYVTFRNHAKVLLVEGNEHTITITGSANMSSQPRVEQYVVSGSPDVFNFFKSSLFEWAMHNAREQS